MITPWEILRRVQPLEVIAKAVAVTLAYLLGFAIRRISMKRRA